MEAGFVQEICVLLRTIVENTTHIDFVIAGVSDEGLADEQGRYVTSYFADFKRDEVSDFGKLSLRQKHVHEVIGAMTDLAVQQTDAAEAFAQVKSAQLMSDVYLTLSNFVHARYPETMDLYGGEPARFHLSGMAGTPKDAENLDNLECYVVTVSNALRFFVLKAGFATELSNDPAISAWFFETKAA